ncbi:hypothetical protein MNB_SV-3-1196 [hydrothermal vent metagenome]|uniref:Uncharacterized protein n=1 Tax=hydrothermal vent metagenome TaxID=652676 RepID=A0A1W1CN35_9ZZZZ
MNGKTQANRLAQLMQKKGFLPSYILALPLMEIRSSSLKKLESGDILLLGLNSLTCLLMDSHKICANVVLVKQNDRYGMQIIKLVNKPIESTNSKKYEKLEFIFGNVQCRTLSVGHIIDIAHINLDKVTLVSQEKTIAAASLVNVEGKIAVKIEKVEK